MHSISASRRRAVVALLSMVVAGIAQGAPATQGPTQPVASGSAIVGDPPSTEDLALAAALAQAPGYAAEFWPQISPDGRLVFFMATYEGQRALYTQRVGSTAAPKKVADLKGRFRHPKFSPDGKSIYFSADVQGDEAFMLKRLVLATGAVEDIEAAEKLNRDGPWFVRGGEALLYTARPTEAAGLVLYERAVAVGAVSTRIYANEKVSLVDVRNDGKQVLVSQDPFGDALLQVDLSSGTARRLFPVQKRANQNTRILSARYSDDGSRVFVATNDGGESTHLLALDTKTGRELARFTERRTPGGDVQSLSVQGNTLAYVLDLGTHHEVRMLDSRTLRPRPSIQLPLGSESPGANHPNANVGLSLSPDGKRLAVQWSTPSVPARIHVIDTLTGALKPLTQVARALPEPVEAEVVQIPSFDDTLVPAIVYRPKGPQRRPVIVSIHGGFPFASTVGFNASLSNYLAAGYVVVEPNVRGSAGSGPAYERADDGAKKLDAVRDFRAVGEWIAKQPWADSQRMAVMGASAGGYHTLMTLAHHPQLWRAGVAVVPLYDAQVSLEETDGDLRVFMDRELVPLSEPATLKAISPSTYVDRIRAPVFVYAGGRDVRTPASQVYMLVRDLRERNRKVEFMFAGDEGHSKGASATQLQLQARILRFLAHELK